MAKNLNNWERFSSIANAIGVIAIPVVIAIFGFYINSNLKSQESETKLVELAVDIIRESPVDTQGSLPIRKWAIDVIDNYSEVKLPQEVKVTLLESTLPDISKNLAKVKPTSYFYDVFIEKKNEKNIIKTSTFQEMRIKNRSEIINQSDNGKKASQVKGNIYGFVSPYDLNNINEVVISNSSTLRRFVEIFRKDNKYYIVGRGLIEDMSPDECCGYIKVMYGVGTQMNRITDMPMGLMLRRKGKVIALPLNDIKILSVSKLVTVINSSD